VFENSKTKPMTYFRFVDDVWGLWSDGLDSLKDLRVFYPQNRPCTPKIVGTFYMQGYKVKEKTAIVPPVSKLSGQPG
jgi:hypothetical protein